MSKTRHRTSQSVLARRWYALGMAGLPKRNSIGVSQRDRPGSLKFSHPLRPLREERGRKLPRHAVLLPCYRCAVLCCAVLMILPANG